MDRQKYPLYVTGLPEVLTEIINEYILDDVFNRFERYVRTRPDFNPRMLREFKGSGENMENFNVKICKMYGGYKYFRIKVTGNSASIELGGNSGSYEIPDLNLLKIESFRTMLGFISGSIHYDYPNLALYFYLWPEYIPVDRDQQNDSLVQEFKKEMGKYYKEPEPDHYLDLE